jgi:hypothetical protein
MALVVVASLLIAGLLAGELLCRAWLRWRARTYIWQPLRDLILESNPEVLPALSPRTRFRTNRFGARGDDVIAAGRTFKVVTCGGSAVECFTLDDEECWQTVAQSALNRPESLGRLGVDRAQVWSIGKSGITTDALCYALPRVLPHFGKIDVLTFMIGMSAVNYWTQIGTPSRLPLPPPPWADIYWHSEGRYGWMPRKTAAAEVFRRARHWIAPPPTKVLKGTGRGLARSRLLRANAGNIRKTYGDPTEWLKHYEDSLVRAVELSKAHARRIVLIRQPTYDNPTPPPEEAAMLWHGFVGAEAGEPCDDYYSHRAFCELLRLIDAATVRAAARSGADVTTPAAVIPSSARTFYDHCHFTPEGARLLGEHLARSLVDLDASAAARPPASITSSPASILRRGHKGDRAVSNAVDRAEDVDHLDAAGPVDRVGSEALSGVRGGDPAQRSLRKPLRVQPIDPA